MELIRTIYLSRVARKVRLADVEAIVERAATRNKKNGITGVLVYTPSHFLQVLEGDEAVVREALARIERDDRHYDMRVLDRSRVPARQFENWAMIARPFSDATEQELTNLSADAALRLLIRASKQP